MRSAAPPPQPFHTSVAEDDVVTEPTVEVQSLKDKNKHTPEKKKTQNKKPMKSTLETELLTPLPKQKKLDDTPNKSSKYKAGDYQQTYMQFILDEKRKGLKLREAQSVWKSSPQRAKLLEGMSTAEKKRRRFI